MLKKNSLKIERDAILENIYYISFDYLSLNNFNVRIFFNACEKNNFIKIQEKDDYEKIENLEKKENKEISNLENEKVKENIIITNSIKTSEMYLNSNMHTINFKK